MSIDFTCPVTHQPCLQLRCLSGCVLLRKKEPMAHVIVLERGLHNVHVYGPFSTEEDAKAYAKTHLGADHGWKHAVDVWRTTELRAPEADPTPVAKD